MKQPKLGLIAICLLALVATSLSLGAQEVRRRAPGANVESGPVQAVAVGPPMFVSGETNFALQGEIFVTPSVSFESKVVKGAPYSAEAVTERTQTLGDGNRIHRRSSMQIYRDSEGRTRREQSVGAVGPWATANDSGVTVFINDPVTGINYVLNEHNRTANKIAYRELQVVRQKIEASLHAQQRHEAEAVHSENHVRVEVRPAEAEAGRTDLKAKIELAPAPGPGEGGGVFMRGPRAGHPRHKPKIESLGKQLIEGVEAEGTRSTLTIPAGEIGNELPIEIVSEQWYSPELQTYVLTRHSDPQTGESIYRLTNINRQEPDRALFEVPTDYTIQEAPAPPPPPSAPIQVRRRKNEQ